LVGGVNLVLKPTIFYVFASPPEGVRVGRLRNSVNLQLLLSEVVELASSILDTQTVEFYSSSLPSSNSYFVVSSGSSLALL
jgi:hypothetical protein